MKKEYTIADIVNDASQIMDYVRQGEIEKAEKKLKQAYQNSYTNNEDLKSAYEKLEMMNGFNKSALETIGIKVMRFARRYRQINKMKEQKKKGWAQDFDTLQKLDANLYNNILDLLI